MLARIRARVWFYPGQPPPPNQSIILGPTPDVWAGEVTLSWRDGSGTRECGIIALTEDEAWNEVARVTNRLRNSCITVGQSSGFSVPF